MSQQRSVLRSIGPLLQGDCFGESWHLKLTTMASITERHRRWFLRPTIYRQGEDHEENELCCCDSYASFVVGMVPGGRQIGTWRRGKQEAESVVYDAQSAFEFLKTLTGEWERSGDAHDHGGDAHSVAFRPTAAGSAVMETMFEGEPMEMISIYHMDGDKLLLTHYCALQNAPIMRFEKSDKPGEIKFVFQGGTNFDPQVDAHVHEGVMRVKDANTLESSFVGYSDGKPDQRPHGILKRKQPKAAK